ncbi:hypothetical protein L2E82_34938 [Cichorium intybus]|uniref:Uncharacterized protein n=1 Tax=Cichorium intybus TaxID=13427 RepID=A0ACB9BN48_CICIN|nr:hypothetical protein L2E82_34938 [Cichorium intybus]
MTRHPRILIITYSSQGNLNPSIRFANRLIKLGASVTVCTSLSVVRRMNKETIPHGLTFAPFSDGHDDGQEPTTTLTQLISDFDTNGASAMAEIISSAAAAGQPFDHLVCNNIIPWAPRVANAHGIKSSLLWIMSATISDIFYYYFNGYQGLISDRINNPTVPIDLPGLPPLTTADLPTFLLPSHPKELNFFIGNLKGLYGDIKTPLRILVNTFNELEVESIRAIEKIEYYPIGPLIPSEFMEGKDSQSNSLGSDFFDMLNMNV